MNYNTGGNPIREISICDCGLTGGCEKCRPPFIGMLSNKEAKTAREKLSRFKKRFNKSFKKRFNLVWIMK